MELIDALLAMLILLPSSMQSDWRADSAKLPIFFSKSTSTAKNEYLSLHNSVIIAQIIDKYVAGDKVLNECIDNIDSDLEDD